MTIDDTKFCGVPIEVFEHAARLFASGIRPGEAASLAYEAADREAISQGPLPLIGFISRSFNIPLSDAKYFVAETLRNACRERFPNCSAYDTWHTVIAHDDIQSELERCIAEAAAQNFSWPPFQALVRKA